ncbi:unnamed protein product [Cuscuta campestris]|uniref:Reverse transcriptase domain-containing protein n=1 Tax=Cuscuta campestris TaxID=132261 RepID=A0A484KNA4_9ASTE|nr:unnamed protein product [Cuscuta campestris]
MGVEKQILLVEEMVHKIDTKVRGGNIIVKIDMAKAFDNLEWQYLQGVLNKLGFSTHAQNLLMANLKSTFLSILINGSPKGYFQMKRGVKQGDPLSPLLFIIAGEGLSRALNLSMKSSYITNYNTGRDMMISHLAFADDIIIFCNGECKNIYKLKHILNMYMEASGQQINYEKSKFYCGNKLGRLAISKIEGILGMKHDKLPFKYLGAPICKGKLKKTDCGELFKHFNKYIDSWYSKTLNQSGRLILIKHVLSSIPLHLIAAHTLPKSVITKLHSMMANFFWGTSSGNNKYHWTKWEDICKPKEEGGLGVRDIRDIQDAYSIKMWWNFRFHNNKWAQFMRKKYSINCFEEKITDSPIRKRICRIHSKAEEFLGDITPDQEDEEEMEAVPITIKQAYDHCRIHTNMQLSDSFIWEKLQLPKIQMFLWKVKNNILPFPDTMNRFRTSFPSQCPFCKKEEATMDHCLLQCSKIQNIWAEMANICEGPKLQQGIGLRQHILEWNLRSTHNSYVGNLRLVAPGIIAWSIWKQFASIYFGGEMESYREINNNIKLTVNLWC